MSFMDTNESVASARPIEKNIFVLASDKIVIE